MQTCTDTGISIPECACPRCLERQFDQFAPEQIRFRKGRDQDSLRLNEVRSPVSPPPVSEPLRRPAL